MKTSANDLINPVSRHKYLQSELTNGLTKREYFAAMAMQAISFNGLNYNAAAEDAVKYADALIAELNKEEK